MSSYYDILNIDSSADSDTIKSAYRKMAKKYHPDANPNDSTSSAKFREIKEAYETLSDVDKRASYDRMNFGYGGINTFDEFLKRNPNFWNEHKDFHKSTWAEVSPDDHYNTGGEGYKDESVPKPNLNLRISLTLEPEEFYKPTLHKVKYTRKIACNLCEGFGNIDTAVGAATCNDCKGSGYIEIEKIISLNIPKGGYVGSVINYKALGNQPVWNGPVGDLLVEIKNVRSGKYIKIDVAGNTKVDLEIHPIDAMLGCTLLVPFPEGVLKHKFKPMEIIDNNGIIIIPGMGIPYEYNTTDHVIKFEYVQMSEDDITLLKSLKKQYENNKKKK